MADKPRRWWDYPAIVFLFVALFASAIRLQTTNWTQELGRVQWLVMIGFALGLLLGLSRLRPWLATLFGGAYTLFFIPRILAAAIRVPGWTDKLLIFATRVVAAGRDLINNNPVQDPTLVLLLLSLLYWLASLLAGYQLVRNGKPWAGLIIAGVMVLVIDYSFEMYASPDNGSALSLVYFLFALLLIARLYFLSAGREWERAGRLVENEVGLDLARTAAVVAILMVLLGWFSPRAVQAFTPGTPEAAALSERFQGAREWMSNFVNSLSSSTPMLMENLGNEMALGTSTNLSESTILTVKPEGGRPQDVRLYWTGRIYDVYEGGQWSSTINSDAPFGDAAGPVVYDLVSRVSVAVEISSQVSLLRTVYFPGVPVTADQRLRAESANAEGEELDVVSLVSNPALQVGETYRVEGLVSYPSQEYLKTAENFAYPPGLLERYTQLPEDFPQSIADLAEEIAGDLPDNFEKTAAITSWLRRNMAYEKTVGRIPDGVDAIEYFLFEIKEGYCSYFASAEVLMLRSLGIPARLNVGYAQGRWNPEREVFTIAGTDFHAWPEVYFPRAGWVPFEPTSAQPVLSYPRTARSPGDFPLDPLPVQPLMEMEGLELPPDSTPATPVEEASADSIWLRILRTSLFGLGGLGITVAAVYFFLGWKSTRLKGTPIPAYIEERLASRGVEPPKWLSLWSRRASRTPFEKLFARVGEMLRLFGSPPDANMTPTEQVARLRKLAPDLSFSSATLLEEYQRATYSQKHGDLARAKRAALSLRKRGINLWIRKFFHLAY